MLSKIKVFFTNELVISFMIAFTLCAIFIILLIISANENADKIIASTVLIGGKRGK